MTKTIYYVASSLDGFIAGPNDELDWLLQFGMEPYAAHYERFISGVGAIVMGSATYEFILGEGADAWTYEMPAWVLTTRDLPTVAGADIRFASGSLEDVHAELSSAAAGKDIWVVGGGALAAQFHALGLLDEIHVTYMPVALGAGKPLFPVSEVTSALEVLDTTPFAGGAVELRYRLR